MCNSSCIAFGARRLGPDEVAGQRLVEVGALDVNGSLRPALEQLGPAEYVGVDIDKGRGVDVICFVEDLAERFGRDRFDVVISTELLEHVRDWRAAISNLKAVCRPGGLLLVTTRSFGFPRHAWPYDFWRYEVEDFRAMFADCTILDLEPDYQDPGVFLFARKPEEFEEVDVSDLELYSMVTGRRVRDIDEADLRAPSYRIAAARSKGVDVIRSVGEVLVRKVGGA
jgi:SAM-dependent methyltransferase